MEFHHTFAHLGVFLCGCLRSPIRGRLKIEILSCTSWASKRLPIAVVNGRFRVRAFLDRPDVRILRLLPSQVQYCQGINYICALFLLYMPEENAFWLLVASMQRPCAPLRELFLPGMMKVLLPCSGRR